ncbi:MAG TPA: hypothetical protein DCW68_01440 [Rhodospirillaceae bacterium]|nr:MAG: hypothetical protein A2018_04405 [Alphaproteobacteria bacterium GWF2_58_20]HAU28761.1 hypothetical protein [Rhodospirillaceae bacterium]
MWMIENFVSAVQQHNFELAREFLEYRFSGQKRDEALQTALSAVLKDKPFWTNGYFNQKSRVDFVLSQGVSLAGHEEALVATCNPLLVETALLYGKTRTPLCRAVLSSKNRIMVGRMLDCWGDVDVKDADGFDLLHYARMDGDDEIVTLVLESRKQKDDMVKAIAIYKAKKMADQPKPIQKV